MTDPRYEAMLGRVAAEVDAGRLWRAKEILLGNLRARGYDLALCERLGQVLLLMGDTVEAGKCLFLSGIRKPEYSEPISLFVRRHTRVAPINLYHALPGYARLGLRDAYPPAVREEFEMLGLPDRLGPPPPPAPPPFERVPRSRLRGVMTCLGCLTVLLVIAVIFVLGAVDLAGRVAGWFRA